jgi:hypothetical protein
VRENADRLPAFFPYLSRGGEDKIIREDNREIRVCDPCVALRLWKSLFVRVRITPGGAE